jgi:hypothetical protein
MTDANGDAIAGGLHEYPKDPWGNEYVYGIKDGDVVVRCPAKDGKVGGEGEDRDYQYPPVWEY